MREKLYETFVLLRFFVLNLQCDERIYVILLAISILTNNNIFMKQREQYESPEIGVVEFANEGVICSSMDVTNPFGGFTEEEL